MYIMSHFWRVSTAVIAGDLSIDLGLSPELLGMLGGAFFYSFGLAQLPMGPLFDRFGPRVVISLLGLLGAASAILFSFADNAFLAIAARAGIGVGMAAVLMGSYKIFTTWFSPQEFATLAGILISVGNLGAITATTPLAHLSDLFGWRTAFIGMASITLLIAIVIYLVVRDHPPSKDCLSLPTSLSETNIFSGLVQVFRSSRFWCLAPLAFASYGTLITVQGLWGGPYLMDTYAMSKAEASSVLLTIPIGIICFSPFWGRWSDRLQQRKFPVLLGQTAMLIVITSLAMNLQLPYWGLLLQFLLLGATNTSNLILYAQVKETFPLAIAGTALTALNFFLVMGAAVIQHIIGLIMENWQPSITGILPVIAYQWGFGVSAVLLALALLIYLRSYDTKS